MPNNRHTPRTHQRRNQLKGLGLLAEALTYPETGETIELVTSDDGTRWFWLHEVADASGLQNLKSTYRRTLDDDEWKVIDVSPGQPTSIIDRRNPTSPSTQRGLRTFDAESAYCPIDVSAGQSTSINSRRGLTSPNAKRVLLTLPGTIRVLGVARKNPKARAFDRWARHEVLAPLLTTGRPAPGGEPAPAAAHDGEREYVDSLLALAFETQAGILDVQRQQSDCMVRLTDILDRVTRERPATRTPRAQLPGRRRTEAAALLARWRNRFLLGKDVWVVATYALPILLEHGQLQAAPRTIAERTGLDLPTVNRALLDLCLVGCLRPVGETAHARHTVYELGDAATRSN